MTIIPSLNSSATFYPKLELGHLEGELRGTLRRPVDIGPKIEGFYERRQVESPGVDAVDLMKALKVVDE